MYFFIDDEKKIIFGWSAKCGCSHIKNIFWFLTTNNIPDNIHNDSSYNSLQKIDDIENYTTIIIIRNPYKRIISGFLQKYRDIEYRQRWTLPTLSFSLFVDELEKKEWIMMDKHHFTPQTSEEFDNKIFLSKNIKFYDIENIDYEYIENLYNKEIPEWVINKKEGHERSINIKRDILFEKPLFDLYIDEFIDCIFDIKYLYNQEIKEKIFNFYKTDFMLFKENGFDYINSI